MPDDKQFDVDGARKAGYSDDEIIQHLTSTRKFDVDGAKKAGYSPSEIIDHLSGVSAAPVTSTPTTGIGPSQPPGFLQNLENWYTTKPTYGGTLSSPGLSPQQKVANVGKAAAAGSLPLVGYGAVVAPVATGLGLAGTALGSSVGGKAGKYVGSQVGAPELGEDVGSTVGGAVGGGLGTKYGPAITGGIGSAVKAVARPVITNASGETRLPIKLAIGKGRSDILSDFFKGSDKAAQEIQAGLQERRAAYAEMNKDFAKKQAAADKAQAKADAAAQKASAKIQPNPFAGMTSTAPGAVTGGAELPPVPQGQPTPFPTIGRKGGLSTPPEAPQTGGPLDVPPSDTSLLSIGRTLIEPGMEPNMANPVHKKMINMMQTRAGADSKYAAGLRTLAKNGDRFADFVLRTMPRP